MFKRMRDSLISTPQAPRSQKIPLPDVGGQGPPTPHRSQTPKTSKSPKTHRRHTSSVDEGYCTSPEASSSRRSPSDAGRPPMPSSQPKGILKHVETPVVKATHVQDLDGYASSPEKRFAPRSQRTPARGESSRTKSKSIPQPATLASITPPVSLHWKLLPYNHQISKARLVFDVAREVECVRLLYTYPARPLTTVERNKPAAEPLLKEMVIRCPELSDWPVYVERASGIRCIDVFEAIHRTYSIILTNADRRIHAGRVRACQDVFEERCRHEPNLSAQEKAQGMRRVDLLGRKSIFQGLDWTPPDKHNPDGSWTLKLATSF